MNAIAKPLPIENDLDAHYIGLPFGLGPMPTVFHFSLSAKDSLNLDPFNQPVAALDIGKMRIMSVTLPFHEDFPPLPENATEKWNKSNFEPFCLKLKQLLDELIKEDMIDPDKIAFMGLSRGAFVAFHMATLFPQVKGVLAFAPMLNLAQDPSLDVTPLAKDLCHLPIRIYMGNRDKKTSTKTAMHFILDLADCAYDAKIRSAPIEMFVTPSLGHSGHGTAKKTFIEGANWIYNLIIDNDE
ncbi:MAG: hypothetical protein P0S95_06675 [Rhabdochlamydiaceae bacterium]|nr:hypothetical protein [Candidatus Amphrikana amoebophyrae]